MNSMQKLLEIGSRIGTPMALAGFVAAAFSGVVWLILAKVPKLNQGGVVRVIVMIIKCFFWLAVIAAVLGFAGYVVGVLVTGEPQPSRVAKHLVPSLPQIVVETLDGLPMGSPNNPALRLNRLRVRNLSEVAIDDFCSRLQLPEPISETIETNLTTGTVMGWRPLLDKLLVKGTAGRTETGLWIGPTSTVIFADANMCFFPKDSAGQLGSIAKEGDITGVWELTIAKLPPGGQVLISFLTSNGKSGQNYIQLPNSPVWRRNPNEGLDANELIFLVEGEYRYQADFKPGRQQFLVPLQFNSSTRITTSLTVQPDIGKWRPIMLSFQ